VVHPEAGTPQGGIISPILANLYLHYVLDLWFEKRVKPKGRGRAQLFRYADDFVCIFEREDDAQTFYAGLGERLGKFGLQLAADKTRIVPFRRGDAKGNSISSDSPFAGVAVGKVSPCCSGRRRARNCTVRLNGTRSGYERCVINGWARPCERRARNCAGTMRTTDCAATAQADLVLSSRGKGAVQVVESAQRKAELHVGTVRATLAAAGHTAAAHPRAEQAPTCFRDSPCLGRKRAERRARCGKSARRDLRGGGGATRRPTATGEPGSCFSAPRNLARLVG